MLYLAEKGVPVKRKKLPIGIQTFSKIREDDYYYVDKTPIIKILVESGNSCFFLSRPRRFGKSLFLDTLAEAFGGNKELFKGLYLENNWDWTRKSPVIRISFASGRFKTNEQLTEHINALLEENANRLNIEFETAIQSVHISFKKLIDEAYKKYSERVVILVDEYDKPILDNLTEPDIAHLMRDGLRECYSVFKDMDSSLRFVFLTGVSKFSKVSIFSGLNNLLDITLLPEFATICGYTDNDMDAVFAPELEGLNRDKIRNWYNGYSWLGEKMYNPFGVLLLFKSREFRSWWFETGTPTFLVNWLKERNFFTPKLEKLFANEDLLSAFDVDYIRPEAMLWQTGYLTIKEQQITPAGPVYFLKVPNHEVRTAFNQSLLSVFLPDHASWMEAGLSLYKYLEEKDCNSLEIHFKTLFASIPHDWYRNNPVANYEGYYASVFYSHLAALGLNVVAEDVSNFGKCDLAVSYGDKMYLFEFKVIDGEESTGEAIKQLQKKDYAAKYRGKYSNVLQIGIEFSGIKRQIVGWDCECL